MTIEQDRAIARKMNKLRMFDIAQSLSGAAKVISQGMEVVSGADYYTYRGPANDVEWLIEAYNEWVNYVEQTQKELGIC